MKNINKYIFILSVLFGFFSCEKDGNMIYLSPLDNTELTTADNNIILSQENLNKVVLSFAWSGQNLVLSDNSMSVIPGLVNTVMLTSLSSDMSNAFESNESSDSKAFTGQELNTLAKNIGADPDLEHSFFFQMKVYAGANTEATYSNIMEVKVTPFFIDMSKSFVLNKDKEDTGVILYSPESDGVYSGFIGAVSWLNFWMKEGDGKVWGNVGVSDSEFNISSDDDSWNMWFPSPGGCYYTIVNTTTNQWSANYITNLKIEGDINAEMTYDRPNNKWYYIFNATTSSIDIRISGDAKQYDVTTACDDDAAKDNTVGFSGTSDNLIFGSASQSVSVTIPQMGEATLVIEMSDPTQIKCYVESGSAVPDEISQYIWVSGIDDLYLNGAWTFDNTLNLYDEDGLKYNGIMNVYSEWGYLLYTEKENWGSAIGKNKEDGSSESGTLATEDFENIPAPSQGLYMVEADMKNMSYSTYEITSVTYAGLNDNWDLQSLTQDPDNLGIFTAEVEIQKPSEWGFKLYLNWNWDLFYGGSDGNLYYLGNGITDDQVVQSGKYILTVDTVKKTYSLTSVE